MGRNWTAETPQNELCTDVTLSACSALSASQMETGFLFKTFLKRMHGFIQIILRQ